MSTQQRDYYEVLGVDRQEKALAETFVKLHEFGLGGPK